MCTDVARNPTNVDYFTLIDNIPEIIIVQESESENIVKCVYLDVCIYSKASSIASASAENIVASSRSLYGKYVFINSDKKYLFQVLIVSRVAF